MVAGNEYEQRVHRLHERIEGEDIDGALFTFPIDIYYFTGSRQNGVLWIPLEGRPTFLVRKSYERASSECACAVSPFASSADLPALIGRSAKRIGMTYDVLPLQQFQFYSGLLAGMEFVDISTVNRELRSVKSPWELEQMRTSGDKLSGVFADVPSFLKPGMREVDLAAEFEYRLRNAGHEGYLRMRAFNQETTGLVAAGASAAVPGCFDGPVTGSGLSPAAPYGPSLAVIEEHVPILIDYGMAANGYIVDMSRVFVCGRLSPELGRAFATAIEIQAWLTENLKPGNVCSELYQGAARIAEKGGLLDHFMGFPGEQAKFVGHGVGLELDELPVIAQKFKSPLLAGQTVAIEPKFLFPGLGVVGIENTYAVTDYGGLRLTDFPDAVVAL